MVIMPLQSERTCVTTGRSHCRATCQGPLESRPRLNLQTPTRPPHEPWYMACHDFPSSSSLRPAEVHAFHLLLKSSPPRKADILDLFGMLPKSYLRNTTHGTHVVSGASPRSPDTGLNHSHDMPFMTMAVNKFMASMCPTHLYSSFVLRRGCVAEVHRDYRNGPNPSCIIALTPCLPGEGLWVRDIAGNVSLSFKGQELLGTVRHIEEPFIFDARNRLHAGFMLPESNPESRVTLVTFTSIHCCTLSTHVRQSLLNLGFPVPSEAAIKRALYGPTDCSLPRFRQLTMAEAVLLPSQTLEAHEVIEILDSP